MQEDYKKVIERIKESVIAGKPITETQMLETMIGLATKKLSNTKEELQREIIQREIRLLRLLLEYAQKYNIYIYSKKEGISDAIRLISAETERHRLKPHPVGLVLKDVPKFKGVDGAVYGPYKPGDVILINEDDYKLLKEGKYIREVSIDL